ncbi:12647_t:CDS:2 [Rhizophagus irregularis]|nr:12647_t:CDS:2 [Rhizophagus irregularis]
MNFPHVDECITQYRKCIVLIRVRHTILYDLYFVTYTSYKNIAPDRIRTIHLPQYHRNYQRSDFQQSVTNDSVSTSVLLDHLLVLLLVLARAKIRKYHFCNPGTVFGYL